MRKIAGAFNLKMQFLVKLEPKLLTSSRVLGEGSKILLNIDWQKELIVSTTCNYWHGWWIHDVIEIILLHNTPSLYNMQHNNTRGRPLIGLEAN